MKRFFTVMILLLCLVAPAAAQQKTGTLKGKVVNAKGKPITGAEVRLMASRDRSITEGKTDQSGVFTFEVVPDEYTVTIDAEGYQGGTLRSMQQVEEGRETQVKTVTLEKAKQESRIRGAVFDESGRSLPGVTIRLQRIPSAEEDKKAVPSFSRSYTTNNHGEFAFRVPSTRGSYRLTAMISGYKTQEKTIVVNESESVPLAFTMEPVKK